MPAIDPDEDYTETRWFGELRSRSIRVSPTRRSGEWLWIGSVSTRRADGSLASYVGRWGESGLASYLEARDAAVAWLAAEDGTWEGSRAVPGLPDGAVR